MATQPLSLFRVRVTFRIRFRVDVRGGDKAGPGRNSGEDVDILEIPLGGRGVGGGLVGGHSEGWKGPAEGGEEGGSVVKEVGLMLMGGVMRGWMKGR